jgi:DNA-binding HxlR family transcriptional regulator
MLKTESQRSDLCSNCPIAKVANLVGDSCILLIIRDLLTGSKRFGEIADSLSGISSRTITKKLKYLEEQGIVIRKEYNQKPPKVEYSLTTSGKRLNTLIQEMHRYGKRL